MVLTKKNEIRTYIIIIAVLDKKTWFGDNPMTSLNFETFKKSKFDLYNTFVDINERIIVHQLFFTKYSVIIMKMKKLL